MNLYIAFLQSLATMAVTTCYNSFGAASYISIYEPEVPAKAKTWKETHETFLGKIARKMCKQQDGITNIGIGNRK